ncbi:MAG TPA: HEAT repeat domain-containing protein [Fimbriimonadaceae bacterium]|nr:HEAT repeat domain-containing protein [Fimbriimonadaceae bacterium]
MIAAAFLGATLTQFTPADGLQRHLFKTCLRMAGLGPTRLPYLGWFYSLAQGFIWTVSGHRSFVRHGRRRNLTWLTSKLRNGTDFERWRALVTLGAIRDTSAVEAITACLDDADARVRQEAVEVLHDIVGEDASDELQRIFNRTDDDVQWLAAAGILNMQGWPVEFDRGRIVRAANLIRSEDADDRQRLILLLSRCPAELVDGPLLEELQATCVYAIPAFRNLVAQGSPAAIGLLRAALESTDKYVLTQVLLALGNTPPPALVTTIEPLANHPDKSVRLSAERALKRRG